MIRRNPLLKHLRAAVKRSRIVALTGPRQCGKTTLAKQIAGRRPQNYFDLEDPESLAQLSEPMTALKSLTGLVVIDEIQRQPELFPLLRVLADRRPLPARFLILGSASPNIRRKVSESLAGRVETVTMSGFDISDVGCKANTRLWQRGGFPRSFLARSDADSGSWRKNFIQTLLERDIPQWGPAISPTALYRFWTMLAHYHGQIWSAADPARSLGVSEPTVRHYLDLLTDVFMVRQLRPYHANLRKRQVKSPKAYIRDTGLLHQLLGIRSGKDLLSHPKCGASWEGFALEETLRTVEPDEAYFWATHNGAEIDLVAIKNGKMTGYEFKRSDAPRLTPSMRIALKDLKLKQIVVVYPGTKRYSLSDRVTVIPLTDLIAAKE